MEIKELWSIIHLDSDNIQELITSDLNKRARIEQLYGGTDERSISEFLHEVKSILE